MKIIRFARPVLRTLLIVLFAWNGLSAQEGLRLIRADLLTSEIVQNEEVRRLSGNVIMEQGNITLNSDKVSHFTARQLWVFEGNVRVIDPEKELKANYIRYDAGENRFYLRGNLELERNNTKLLADRAIYYPDRNYYSFAGNVRYMKEGESMRADSADYLELEDVLEAYENVRYWNERDNIRLNGKTGRFSSSEEYGMVTGNPSVSFTDSTSGEMTWIYGETMEYFGEKQYVRVRQNVRVTRGTLSAVSDTAWYYPESQTAKMSGGPKIYEGGKTITGKEVSLLFDENSIRKLLVEDEAKASMPTDSGDGSGLINELTGSVITIDFRDNKITQMRADRNATCRYYISEGGANQGANVVSGTSISLVFEEEGISKVIVEGGSEGLFYPPSQIDKVPGTDDGSGR